MKKAVLIILLFLFFGVAANAQDSRPATKEDVTFHNKIRAAFKESLNTTYKDWEVAIPKNDLEPMTEGELIDYCEGSTCWRDDQCASTCDGSQIQNDFFKNSQAEIQKINTADKNYIQKMGEAMGKFENETSLEIKLFVNVTEVEKLIYCKPKGYKKETPPDGWNSYYTSNEVLNCYKFVGSNDENTKDVSVFSMGVVPQLSEGKVTQVYYGKTIFSLNKNILKSYQIQNVVLYIRGSKVNALEYVKNMNTASLQKLLKP